MPIERLDSLRENIEVSHENGLFDEDFYQEYLSGFVFRVPEELPGARSVIIVGGKQPRVRFTFNWKGKPVQAVVPPTYLHGGEFNKKARENLSGILGPEGFQVVQARIPLKLLAVRSGLASYGRNNITYIKRMGSFLRMAAFFSDMPCDTEGEWNELKMMESCKDCHLCTRVCPTSAISPTRFLLHAERCVVYHNEKPGDVPFPTWMDASCHNSLVGCMLCQRVCPEDKKYLDNVVEGPEFSAEETALLVKGIPQDQLPFSLQEKLRESDLISLMDVIPRNLKALVER